MINMGRNGVVERNGDERIDKKSCQKLNVSNKYIRYKYVSTHIHVKCVNKIV